MAKITSEERVLKYSNEFKIGIVKLTEELGVHSLQIAETLNLHPVMVYRWRQEYREGKLVPYPTKRVNMTLERSTKPPPTKKQLSELERLKKENAALKKENDFLKKWERYLADQKKKDSRS